MAIKWSDIAPKDYKNPKLIYKVVKGKRGIWLVPVNIPNPGDEITFWEDNPNSQGYGGSTLSYEIEDGSTLSLKGPWQSNSTALFEDTGLDIRDKHKTFAIISESREYVDGQYFNYYLNEIHHQDSDWVIGRYNRANDLAQEIANKLNKPVYLSKKSNGGGSYGAIQPNRQTS